MVELRATRPVERRGKKIKVTVVKTTVDNEEEARTIKRTVDGESADLQIKWVKHPSGEFEIVHLHCMKDKERSAWNRTEKMLIDKVYDVTKNDGTWTIRCRTCGRVWKSGG